MKSTNIILLNDKEGCTEGKTMLLQFSVKNYRSFVNETILDFIATPKCRDLEGNLVIEKGNKILPVIVIYGANASGKSNLITAIRIMYTILMQNQEKDKPLPVVPFAFDDLSSQKPTQFEIVVSSGNYTYRYGFCATKTEIIEEWLYREGLSIRSTIEEKKMYVRKKNKVQFEGKYNEPRAVAFSEIIDDKTLLLSLLGKAKLKDYENVFIQILIILSVPIGIIEGTKYFLDLTASTIKDDKKQKESCVNLLHRIDPCIVDIEVREEIDEDQDTINKLYTCHYKGGKKTFYPLEIESSGTRKIISIFTILHTILKNGGVIVVDELDNQLHPLLLREIVSMFHDPNINTGKGQLVFTAHNPILLDKDCMRRDEIWFTEKDDDGKSTLYPLIDIRDKECVPRSDSDYLKKYFLGLYGAIPFINGGENNGL